MEKDGRRIYFMLHPLASAELRRIDVEAEQEEDQIFVVSNVKGGAKKVRHQSRTEGGL